VVAREPRPAAWVAGASGALLLLGGHRANHGAGGPTDRILDDLLDRAWDAAILSGIAWVARDTGSSVAVAALAAVSLSFVAGYIRARGAALGYSVEERHVTRGARYTLVVVFLAFGWTWAVWAVAVLSGLAAAVRAGQVAREERAA
jgi:phosphatidylglycerophosphate synthase